MATGARRRKVSSAGKKTSTVKPLPSTPKNPLDPDKKDEDEDEENGKKEPNMLETAAEGIEGAAKALGGLGGGGKGQMLQAPGTVGKGGIGHVDPEMRARLERKLAGRGGKGFKKGGSVKSRDGIAIRGKTKGRSV